MRLQCKVNGNPIDLEIKPNLLLVDLLREHLHLTGTKNPLDFGQTGSCTVFLNGRIVKSSMLLAVQAMNKEIITIEGLKNNNTSERLIANLIKSHAIQCGFCTPAIVVVLTDLLERIAHPTEHQIRECLDSVLCRCTGYQNIVIAAMNSVIP